MLIMGSTFVVNVSRSLTTIKSCQLTPKPIVLIVPFVTSRQIHVTNLLTI